MTKMKACLLKPVALLAAALSICTTGFGAVVYDNTSNLSGSFYGPGDTAQFGDQVFLQGADRRVTDFSFDYFLNAGANGGETAQLFLYANDGANGAPSTLLYSTPVGSEISLTPGGGRINVQALNVIVPTTFTWAVSFQGVDAGFGESAGLLLADPPTAGSSLNDFWLRGSNGSWSTLLIDNGATAANFSARITAVPEPATFALVGVGVVALVGFRRRR